MDILKTKILPHTAIVADIHQCSFMLGSMIDTCKNSGVNNFIFLGDILDRGTDPIETVEMLLEINDISTFILGNHDFKLLKYFNGRNVHLNEEQERNISLFKEKNLLEPFCNLFKDEYIAVMDEEQKVMLSHAPGFRPAKLLERHNKNEMSKDAYSRMLYGLTNGLTDAEGRPIRRSLTKFADDLLDGWILLHGHTHGGRLYNEPSPAVMCLDFKCGEDGGMLGAWIVTDTVRNGRLLVINQQGEATWNPPELTKPYNSV